MALDCVERMVSVLVWFIEYRWGMEQGGLTKGQVKSLYDLKNDTKHYIWELPRKKVPQIAKTKLSTVSINSNDLIAEELSTFSIKLVGSCSSTS